MCYSDMVLVSCDQEHCFSTVLGCVCVSLCAQVAMSNIGGTVKPESLTTKKFNVFVILA